MNLKEITLIVVVRESSTQGLHEEAYLEELRETFRNILTVAHTNVQGLAQVSDLFRFRNESALVERLNAACACAGTRYILLLESDEKLNPNALEQIGPLDHECYSACINGEAEGKKRWHYDIRLFPVPEEGVEPFRYSVLPDLSEYILSRGLTVSDRVFMIQKKGEFAYLARLEKFAERNSAVSGNSAGPPRATGFSNLSHVPDSHSATGPSKSSNAPDFPNLSHVPDSHSATGSSNLSHSATDWYWLGVYNTEKQRYIASERCFRRALQGDRLLKHHRLSSLNGLAFVLQEQNRKDEALQAATQSDNLDSRQYAPCIIRHKIHWMRGEWQQAYNALKNYLDRLPSESRACLDFFLAPAEAHFLMAELSLILKNNSGVFDHYDHFYRLHEGNVSEAVIDKLFVYAIILGRQKKAIEYLNLLLNSHLVGNADESGMQRVLAAVSLLEEKEWYESACEVYEKLFCLHPRNQRVLRRWLVALARSGKTARANKVMQIIKKERPATLPLQESQPF